MAYFALSLPLSRSLSLSHSSSLSKCPLGILLYYIAIHSVTVRLFKKLMECFGDSVLCVCFFFSVCWLGYTSHRFIITYMLCYRRFFGSVLFFIKYFDDISLSATQWFRSNKITLKFYRFSPKKNRMKTYFFHKLNLHFK